jgi:predicted polyphosphate/ATP-dependent NAD kinase
MVRKGTELFVIFSGDGTHNDAVQGVKSVGVTLPIFGILLIGSMLSVL